MQVTYKRLYENHFQTSSVFYTGQGIENIKYTQKQL